MKMKLPSPLVHVKRTAKRIKNKYPHIKLGQVQHDLANYLGFQKWKNVIDATPIELQRRIDKHPLKGL